MTQEMRGLGSNYMRAHSVLNRSLKPKPSVMASLQMGSGTSGGSGPVKVQSSFIEETSGTAQADGPVS